MQVRIIPIGSLICRHECTFPFKTVEPRFDRIQNERCTGVAYAMESLESQMYSFLSFCYPNPSSFIPTESMSLVVPDLTFCPTKR